MARLKAAGLNPNLMYGNGADTGNAAAPSAAGSSGSFNSNVDAKVASGLMQRQSDIEMMRQLKELALLDSQIDLNEANAHSSNTGGDLNISKIATEVTIRDLNRANTAASKADAAYKEWKLGIDQKKSAWELKRLEQDYKNSVAEYDEIVSRTGLNKSQEFLNTQNWDFLNQLNPKLLDEKDKQLESLSKQISLIGEQIKTERFNQKLINQKINESKALVKQYLSQAGLNYAQANKVSEELLQMCGLYIPRLIKAQNESDSSEYQKLQEQWKAQILEIQKNIHFKELEHWETDRMIHIFTLGLVGGGSAAGGAAALIKAIPK